MRVQWLDQQWISSIGKTEFTLDGIQLSLTCMNPSTVWLLMNRPINWWAISFRAECVLGGRHVCVCAWGGGGGACVCWLECHSCRHYTMPGDFHGPLGVFPIWSPTPTPKHSGLCKYLMTSPSSCAALAPQMLTVIVKLLKLVAWKNKCVCVCVCTCVCVWCARVSYLCSCVWVCPHVCVCFCVCACACVG